MESCNYDTKKFFLHWMRIFFGIWLLYVGMVKWCMIGSSAFVGYITGEFDKTWSPHILNTVLAWVILVAEPLLALLLLSGKHPRKAWMLTTFLMFMLAFGQTILMKPDVYANWLYLVLTLVCASMSDPIESCCSKS